MLRPREEGSGGRDGIVLNLTMSGDGVWDAVYSVKAFVGKSEQPLMLSVDTGSSDVWLASKDCQSSACGDSHTTLYDPSSSISTNQNLDLLFLRGSISGPIVWEPFKIGPYLIPFQALAAADQVTDESLSSGFVGLIGLALPPNSKIAQRIPATESDSPDGATLQMNLFGLTPVDTAPEQRFFSLSLERPGSSRIPSLLGIGKHPSNLVPGFDPSKIAYSELISTSRSGDTFWRVHVMNITAWVNGVPKPVQLGRSTALPTSPYTVGLVDSGGPNILASVDIVNGIYGAWGIGPGQDGNYYVPCTTPMNISFEIANFPPIPLHPLDVTSPPRASKADSSSSMCLGQIQAAPSDKLLGFADIVLGVSFLRNVYTVLSSSSSANTSTFMPGSPNPRLGVLPLTDPTTAMSEFHAVRVLGQPLEQSPSSSSQQKSSTIGKKLSVGITVLVCIVGFFVACGLLFGVRWWLLRRRFKRKGQTEERGKEDYAQSKDKEPGRWEDGKKKDLFYPESSTGSDFTRLEQFDSAAGTPDEGARTTSPSRSRSPTSSASEVGHVHGSPETAYPDSPPEPHRRSAMHVRTMSSDQGAAAVVPLLEEGEASPWSDTPPAHERVPSSGSVSFADEAGMAGVGVRSSTASSSGRTSRSRPRGPRASGGSISSVASRMWHAEVGQVIGLVDDSPRS